MNDLAPCKKCGSPILGNEWFCSNCGKRVTGAWDRSARPKSAGRSPLVWTSALLAAAALFGAILWVARRSVAEGDEHSSGGAVSRVAKSLRKIANEEKRLPTFGCRLLSTDDAAKIAQTAITRTESASDSCAYYGIPDPPLNPEAIAVKSMPGLAIDSETSKKIDGFTAGMRSLAEQQDPGARAGPGGERLLFSIHCSAALSASMELGRQAKDAKAMGEAVPGIGDEAFFLAMDRMFFVRKDGNYILIQPQFVKDPHGVAIAAARKVLESPNFRD